MIEFNPKKLPCDIDNISDRADDILENTDRIMSALKVLSTMVTIEETKKFYNAEDIKYQLETISEILSLLCSNVTSLKAEVNFLNNKQ